MAVEQTLSIIKPDAVAKNVIGGIYHMLEEYSFRIIAAKMIHLTREQATQFYDEHEDKPFFNGLIDFMTSGPVMIQVLECEGAISRYRKLMGSTNPRDADLGTIRHKYAIDDSEIQVQENAVHGSDSIESATREIEFFFKAEEICPRTR